MFKEELDKPWCDEPTGAGDADGVAVTGGGAIVCLVAGTHYLFDVDARDYVLLGFGCIYANVCVQV